MATEQQITVLVVDDQLLVRDGIVRILETQQDMRVVGAASDGHQAVTQFRRLRPDVVLMDVRMPGTDGIDATRAIVAEAPEARVVGLTTFDTDNYAIRMLTAGAVGFILKDGTIDQLVDAIRSAHHGSSTIAAPTVRRLLSRITSPTVRQDDLACLDVLTRREREVFDLVITGATNLRIAGHLGIAEVTVKSHIGRVLAKLGTRDRVQLLLWAHAHRPGEDLSSHDGTSGCAPPP